jgi:hypothetical protein
VPVNFHEVSHSQKGGGTLEFRYEYQSSTGNLNDLQTEGCVIKEQVVYPNGIGNYIWPTPWQFSTPSPTVLGVPIVGFFFDDHDPGTIVPPYNPASVVAQQRYIYICPCANGGNPVVLAGVWPITRSISRKSDGKYKYTIVKTDGTASIDPLP